jgi:hypothetical protein
MRRRLLFFITILVIFTVGCLSGCGGCGCQGDHSYDLPELEEDHEVTTDSTALPSEDELEAPVYDQNLDTSQIDSSKTESNGEVVNVGVDYDSKDDFQTVVSWYKGQLGEPKEITQLPNGHYQASWQYEKNGRSVLIILTCTDTGTAISIINDKI